jgi:catechol 2,3-dioxygenase-like lactoylglutathione lyase family enzyme
MATPGLFLAAFTFAADVLALPVEDIDRAAEYYCSKFGMTEVGRSSDPPTVILERDGVQIGFSVNGGDASQDGAAVLVSDIDRAREELAAAGVEVKNQRVDERDGKKFQVFFVVAPDGLCYYYHAELGD